MTLLYPKPCPYCVDDDPADGIYCEDCHSTGQVCRRCWRPDGECECAADSDVELDGE